MRDSRRARFSLCIAALLCAIGATGCPPAEPTAPRAASPPDTIFPLTAYRYPAAPPVVDSLTVRDMVADARGRVVLLYFWTRYSEDARSELRRIVKLQRDYYDRGLGVIACSADDPADWVRYTRPLLLGVRGNFPCVIVTEPTREALRTWLGSKWQYDMPARFLFDRNGQKVAAFPPGTPFGDVAQAVIDLLETSPPSAPESTDREAAPEPAISGPRATIKLIDVRRGETVREFGPVGCSVVTDVDPVGDQIAAAVSSRDAQTAVAPFASRAAAGGGDRAGVRLAERLTRCLRLSGMTDVTPVAVTRRKLDELDMSALDVESDPARLREGWPIDYVVIGWIDE